MKILSILKIARPLYKLQFILFLVIFLGAVLQQVAPIISKYVVDEVVLQLGLKSGDLSRVYQLVVLMFLVNVAGVALGSIGERLGDLFAARIRKLLIERFYEKVLYLPQPYFDTEISGKILHQLTRGITTIQHFMNTGSNFILPTLMQSVFTIVVLAFYSPAVALFIFILFPIYILISHFSAKAWGKREVAKNKHEDEARGRMQEVISNIKVVKIFSRQWPEFEFVSGKMSKINSIYHKQSNTFHIYDFIRNLSLVVIILLVNLIIFDNASKGIISIGEMVLIIQLVIQAQRPLFGMSFILTQLQLAEAGAKDYLEILNYPESERQLIDAKPEESLKLTRALDLEFKNVKFAYPESGDVFKDLSLKFKAGEKVAIVGKSGAGKTTLINLIARLYAPQSGDIFIAGQPYSQLEIGDVREQVALVFQDNELFSSTVRENITYARPSATDAEVESALKQANAYDFVEKLPQGVHSKIGERGVRLSGGQKQRLQIARAILAARPILILDEATSSLDSESETEIQHALENLIKDKLVIIIAHRFSTIQSVDRVVVLADGGIAQAGSPKQLANEPGLYADLLRYQVEGNKQLLKQYDIIG
jgi:ATP-binding cassette subfamily B protein